MLNWILSIIFILIQSIGRLLTSLLPTASLEAGMESIRGNFIGRLAWTSPSVWKEKHQYSLNYYLACVPHGSDIVRYIWYMKTRCASKTCSCSETYSKILSISIGVCFAFVATKHKLTCVAVVTHEMHTLSYSYSESFFYPECMFCCWLMNILVACFEFIKVSTAFSLVLSNDFICQPIDS